MAQPSVVAVMLADGRPEMVARAIHCFEAQTYYKKRLQIFNTGAYVDVNLPGNVDRAYGGTPCASIGSLRNQANFLACWGDYPDILIHWDSDDWSHPSRIAEQVEHLQKADLECVGYNEMLIWQTSAERAWIYKATPENYCMGTSMCYWRRTWERVPFAETGEGCDDLWWYGKVAMGARSAGITKRIPRMIAGIHGRNTCARIDADAVEWRLAPMICNEFCKEKMAL